MGNTCCSTSEKSLAKDSHTDFRAADNRNEGRGNGPSPAKKRNASNGNRSSTQRLYNDSLYDPVQIKHDPDIVSKDPFVFERENSLFRPGTTKRSKIESLIQPPNACDFSKYDHGAPSAPRNDKVNLPAEGTAKIVQAMNKISDVA